MVDCFYQQEIAETLLERYFFEGNQKNIGLLIYRNKSPVTGEAMFSVGCVCPDSRFPALERAKLPAPLAAIFGEYQVSRR